MKKNINTLIGDNIRLRRTHENINQADLAQRVGLSRTQVVNMEQGNSSLTMDNLYKICISLDCELTDILPTIEEMGCELVGRDVIEAIQKTSPDKLRRMLIGFI